MQQYNNTKNLLPSFPWWRYIEVYLSVGRTGKEFKVSTEHPFIITHRTGIWCQFSNTKNVLPLVLPLLPC